MRKIFIALCVLVLAAGLSAQQRTGNIYGKVVDPEGNALPGVTVTLTGQYTAAQTQVTGPEGNFRFLSLPPARDYAVKLELAGFKTHSEEGIIVAVGSTANISLTMEPGVLEEQITVVAVTPMVDSKKTSVGTNVTQDVLQSLPTARDPWVIMQMAPSIIMDRENVGGNESGQQASYVSRGATNYNNNVWAMDGLVITDPAAIGASPSYYDFDAFEEMQITVGGSDVTVQTGGVALNMITRRGGNRISFGGRFYWTDAKLQAKNEEEVAKLVASEPAFLGVNAIRRNKDYGFNMGLPVVRDKAWLWASYGEQDIKTNTVYGTPDDTQLENYAAKFNLQIIPQNRFEAFIHVGGKVKVGRSATASNPEGLRQGGRYYLGSPIIKFQDEHMFGDNMFISLKYGWSDAGFNMTPMTDLDFNDVMYWDVTAQRYFGSQAARYWVSRPVTQYNALLNYFNDNLFGATHDIKLGVEYADRNQYVESVRTGNLYISQKYNTPVVDFNGDGYPDVPTDPNFKRLYFRRGYYSDQHIDALSGYFQDTLSFGRFNVLLGLRYDRQTPWINPFTLYSVDNSSGVWDKIATPAVQTALNGLLPGIDIPKTNVFYTDGSQLRFNVLSPRLGFTWDVTGDGKTIAKLSASTYGDFMGTGTADWARPGGVSGWMTFWWQDNGDGMMSLEELYWATYRASPRYQLYRAFDDAGNFVGDWADTADSHWAAFDYANPLATTDPYTSTHPDAGSGRTSELMLQLDREIFTDFAVSVIGTYRKYDQFNWTLKYWLQPDGSRLYEDRSMFISAGTPEASYPGLGSTKEAANHEWYYQSTFRSSYSPYSERQRRPDYYTDYLGLDLVLNKRLSNKWMANANFTWQKQAQYYGSDGYLDPTNIWAYDGYPQAAYIGGASGKISQYTYSRWMFKAGGLYQLPFDINVSGTFNIREGWVVDEYMYLRDYRLPNPTYNYATLRMDYFGENRLPLFYNLSLRLEKMLRLGDTGRIYIMADVFNVLNKMIDNRRYQLDHGSYYVYPDASQNRYVPYPNMYALNEVLNPRVTRLGVRFTF